MNFKHFFYTVVINFSIFIFGCSDQVQEITWDYNDVDIVGTPFEKKDKIDIDIYLDATTSMEGFAISSTSIFGDFLDQLETSSLSAWKEADLKFYKFGERVKEINRDEYLSAKNNVKFYNEAGIFKKTFIDSVVSKTDRDRLSVLITDLFQDEGDVNIMVDRFKNICFKNKVMVGIIGIRSGFNGKVFDVPSYPKGYKLESEDRPFYAILFGNPYNMEYLFGALKKKDFIKEENFLLFSPYIIRKYETTLTKSKDSKFVNKKAPRQEVKNSFDFSMKEEGKEAQFDLEINLARNSRCTDFSIENLEPVIYKKTIKDSKTKSVDSSVTKDISIENIRREGDKIKAIVRLNNSDGIGNYSYLIYLKSNPLNGLITPDWIKEFSTDNPVSGEESANKTYNLEKLVNTMIVANATVSPTLITKFYINIYKR